MYRTFRSVCALRGLSAPEGCVDAGVPYSSLRKLSPDRSSGQLPPTADNLLRMLLWMDPGCDLAQYATEHAGLGESRIRVLCPARRQQGGDHE